MIESEVKKIENQIKEFVYLRFVGVLMVLLFSDRHTESSVTPAHHRTDRGLRLFQ